MGHPLVEATLELYKNVQASFLPTPLKCHYMFNLRDFAKVIQGKVVSNKVEKKNSLYLRKSNPLTTQPGYLIIFSKYFKNFLLSPNLTQIQLFRPLPSK